MWGLDHRSAQIRAKLARRGESPNLKRAKCDIY